MAKDGMKTTASDLPLSDDQVADVYRDLAQEHCDLRHGGSPQSRAALAQGIWLRVERKMDEKQRSAAGASSWARSAGSHWANSHWANSHWAKAAVRSPRLWAVAALCVATLGGAYWWTGSVADRGAVTQEEGRVGFEVDGTTIGPQDAKQGHLIASESTPVGIVLSDRSQINLLPHTTVRLAALSDGVVITRMSQGTLDAEVVHQQHTDYQFFAGPYLVKVIGTAFRLSYVPEDEELTLKMRSGAVEVLGPEGTTRVVVGGETLHLKRGDMGAPAEVERGDAGEAEGSDAASSVEATSLAPSTSAGAPTVQKAVDFHRLAAAGEFSEIVRIAQARGISTVLATAPADQLQELAQAARYSGRADLAERVWNHMSSRFASSSFGRNATFFLGRLDEQRGRSTLALGRYETYLRTSPGGVYAQEAWGRKLQLSQSSRGDRATRLVAEQYLARFPQGPYAETARTILDRAGKN